MAYVALSSDLHGNLFSIDHNGDLRCNQRTDGGAGPMLHPGLGEAIGTGWTGIHHFAAARAEGWLVLTGIGDDGTVVSAQTPKSLIAQWRGVKPVVAAGVPWKDVRTLCGGANGELYAIDVHGRLQRRRFGLAPRRGKVLPLQPGAIDVLGEGWGGRLSVFTNGTRFFDVMPNGDLRYQETTTANPNFASGRWIVLDRAWTGYQRAFAADADGIYTISSEGVLIRRGIVVEQNDKVRLARRSTPAVLGTGIVGWYGLPAEVEGYCTPQSAAPGESISFMVAARLSGEPVTKEVSYSMNVVRLRRMRSGKEGVYDTVVTKQAPMRTARPGKLPGDWLLKGAQWRRSFKLTIPKTWRSGVYAARCTDENNNSFYVPFVVRPARRTSPFAIIANTNTWNAYNSWGGQGKYAKVMPLPRTLPFKRPHPGLTPDVPWDESVKHEILNQSRHLLRAELWVLGWLDGLRRTYPYDLFTDEDLHRGFAGLGERNRKHRYKALILTVHPEYWTEEMYDRVQAYQRLGGSIVYLGGNGIYEQVRLTRHGGPMEIFPGVDWTKIPSGASNEFVRTQCLLRVRGRPERALIGVGFENGAHPETKGQAYLLATEPSKSRALAGLKLKVGAPLGASSANTGFSADGWEVDQRGGGTPEPADKDEALLALGYCKGMSGEMLYYETGKGGVVFAAGSLSFGGSLAVDSNLQLIVMNVLDICLTR